MRAQDIMTTPAVCVGPGTALGEVAAILTENGFTAVPVVDEGDRLVGLVSEADLIRERFGLHPHPPTGGEEGQPRSTAGAVMTTPVEFVRPQTTLSALAKCMLTGRRRSVPVVEDGRVVGIVTRRDVVKTMARSDDAILEGVHERLAMLGCPNRWLIRVQAGVVHLWGETDAKHEHEAMVVAESVPGVIRVTVSGPGRPSAGSGVGIAQAHR
jgi:CBS domain-containing protein